MRFREPGEARMTGTVWCVFQKLPGEKCPSLAAVCRTREVAEMVCGSSRREAEASGEPESEWSIAEWTVLDAETERRAERADQISHVLDPMRAGLAAPHEESDGDGAGDGDESEGSGSPGSGGSQFPEIDVDTEYRAEP